MPDITITTGATVTEDAQNALASECWDRYRFMPGSAAAAILDLYSTLDQELLFRATAKHTGDWHRWNGRYWQHYIETELRRDLKALLGPDLTASKLSEVANTMSETAARPWGAFDKSPIVTYRNCCLAIENNKVVSKSFAKQNLATYEIPITYVDTGIKEWITFLRRLLPNADDRATLQELYGYTLLPTANLESFFIMTGEAHTGKSTVLAVLADMLGPARCSAVPSSKLSSDFGLQPMEHAIVNIDAEAEYIEPRDEVVIKQISSQDPISMNKKGIAAYQTIIHARLVMACNTIPKFGDKSEGVWSRLVLLPFNETIPASERQRRDHVLARLRPEYGGILHWGLIGLLRILDRGTRATAFTQSATAKKLVGDHRHYSDPFLDWYEEHVEPDPEEHYGKQDTYNHYRTWSLRLGYKPTSIAKFTKAMEKKGHNGDYRPGGRDTNRRRAFSGVRLVL